MAVDLHFPKAHGVSLSVADLGALHVLGRHPAVRPVHAGGRSIAITGGAIASIRCGVRVV